MAGSVITLGSDSYSAKALCERYAVSDEDQALVARFGEAMIPKAGAFVDGFYVWLESQPYYEEFFPDRETNQRVRKLMLDYWKEFFTRDLDDSYVQHRQDVGKTHARIGLSLDAYFAAMNHALHLWTVQLHEGPQDDADYARLLGAMTRKIHLDTAVVVQAYSDYVARAMAAQSKALMEMSTPVTQLWTGILMLPVVGIIDSKRAQDVMNAMLKSIASSQARNFILDISGVAVVDTAVANHLIKITKASALMGCNCTISGISPAIAQTIVELGIEVGSVETTATMKDALGSAFRKLGLSLVDRNSA
jgi:rsbT co-antagonist protein RsbR